MTERQWLLYSGNPEAMLLFLASIDEASERKLRLFAVACCRHILGKVQVSRRAEHALDAAELYADGVSSAGELEEARCYANTFAEHVCMNATETDDVVAMACCASLNAWAAAKHESQPPHDNGLSAVFNARLAVEQGVQCGLLWEIFGPLPFGPFRPPMPSHRLTNAQLGELEQLLFEGAPAHGCPNEL
jgi:hypothetical protein